MKNLLLIMLLFTSTLAMMAQDRIYKRNGEIIEALILEIGDYELRYKVWENQSEHSYSLDASQVRKVLFANGEVKAFDKDFIAPLKLEDQRKNAIKFSVFSPLSGSFQVTWEKYLKNLRSHELTLSYIGFYVGAPNYVIAEGFGMRYGYKFKLLPDYYLAKMKSSHVLQGAYVRPDIVFSKYNYEFISLLGSSGRSGSVAAGAFTLNFGKQTIIGNALILDGFVGVGYGFTFEKGRGVNEYARFHYGFSNGNQRLPISINSGIRLGFAYGKK